MDGGEKEIYMWRRCEAKKIRRKNEKEWDEGRFSIATVLTWHGIGIGVGLFLFGSAGHLLPA
jgi:hypothetical protein